MDPGALSAMTRFRTLMFERVYESPARVREHRWAIGVITRLVEALHTEPPRKSRRVFGLPDDPPRVRAVDYVAGFTDRAAILTYERLFGAIPK